MKHFFLISVCAALAWAQVPETILINGKILTVDARDSIQQALAIRDGKIAAVGTAAQIRALAGASTRVIDLGGRTVIPGLIDSHLHAIRAGLSFATEVNWAGARSLTEALDRVTQMARERPAGSWLVVAGGWTQNQFKERRPPTQAELIAAAPRNPVYVQLGYNWAMLTPLSHERLGLDQDGVTLPGGGRFEVIDGKRTGAIAGGIIELFELLPKPTFAEQVEGTKLFFRELNRLGMTGVVDPGGNNLTPDLYEALFQVWRAGDLTVRVAFSLNGQTEGKEFEEIKSFAALVPQGFGDDVLHFNGLGERITYAMNNNNNPTATQKEQYYQILKWAADRGMTITMHWANDASVGILLDLFEAVNKETPIAPLRWSVAHLSDASEATLQRMKTLGVGWTVQDAQYFGGDALVARNPNAGRRIPPVNTAKRIGVHVGAGTDAHRVASYNPFTSLQWFLDGKTVSGVAIRGPEETPSREDALRLYTLGSAWISHDDDVRGSLEVGKFADLAVLSADYLTVPVDQVGNLESLLTMVGGKVVWSAGAFADRR